MHEALFQNPVQLNSTQFNWIQFIYIIITFDSNNNNNNNKEIYCYSISSICTTIAIGLLPWWSAQFVHTVDGVVLVYISS